MILQKINCISKNYVPYESIGITDMKFIVRQLSQNVNFKIKNMGMAHKCSYYLFKEKKVEIYKVENLESCHDYIFPYELSDKEISFMMMSIDFLEMTLMKMIFLLMNLFL